MAKPKDVKTFLTDPAHKEDADFMREATRAIMAEEIERSKTKPKEGLFGFLFEKSEGGVKMPWEL